MPRRFRSLAIVLSTVMFGCAVPVGGDDIEAHGDALRRARPIEFTPIQDPQIVPEGREVRRLITSARQYERLFGHTAPGDVDFAAGDAVVYYSAGLRFTGGFEATIQSIELRLGRLHVTTRVSSPGENCIVTQALSHPHALVKLRRPRVLFFVTFTSDDVVQDCEAPRSCDDVVCPLGQHCELVDVWCIRAPCPALPSCLPDTPFCGGIAGFPCPGAGSCVDDPDDECDPEMGGADCGGQCVCEVLGSCEAGFVWDETPEVCGCVPDPSQDPCAAVRCRAGTHCEADGESAVCVPDAFCGGFAGFPCPGAGTCIDDPGDDCDPTMGGADCGGLCVCEVLGSCESGFVWDDSPKSCGCVPEVNPCAAVLCQTGTTCEVIDGEPNCLSDGSQECGASVCPKGTGCCNASCGVCTPPGVFCTQEACL
jgi:hypothetical protein